MRVCWPACRPNQSILKESVLKILGRTDAEAESPILWPPYVTNWLFGKDPDARKDEGRRRRGRQRISWLECIIDSMDMSE